jgi:phage terminase large subunit-like protein
MGGLDDLFSIYVIGRERGEGERHWRRWLGWGHSWCCKVAVEKRKSEASLYEDFVRAGELTIVDSEREQIDQAVDVIEQVFQAGLLGGIGADPWMVSALVDAVESAGIRPDDGRSTYFEAVRQGGTVGRVSQAVEWKLKDRSMLHAGQSIMAYAVGNLKVEMQGNAPAIHKQTAGSAKIDPAMAMFDAAFVMGRNPEPAAALPEIFVI